MIKNQHQTTQNTNHGTSSSSQKEQVSHQATIEIIKALDPAEFEVEINKALDKAREKGEPIGALETTKETFDAYRPWGDKAAYYIYKGVKIYKQGDRAAIEKEEAKTIYDLVK